MFSVEDIMKTDVLVARPHESIRDAINLMGRNRVSGLPVVDDQQNLLGVVTEYDLLKAFHDQQDDATIAEIMSTDVVTAPMQATLDELLELFLTSRLRRVLIALDGKLEGVISRRDLLYAAQSRRQLNDWKNSQAASCGP